MCLTILRRFFVSLNINQTVVFFILKTLCCGIYSVKSVRMRSFSGPYFPAFGLNTERDGKIRTRKTLNTATFHAVILCSSCTAILVFLQVTLCRFCRLGILNSNSSFRHLESMTILPVE